MTTVMTTSVGVQGEYLQHGASIAIERPYDLDDFVSSTNFEFVADILQQDTPTDIRAHWAVIKLAFTMVERERQHRMRLEERVAILERQVEKLSVPEPASAPLRPDLEPASNHVDDDLRGDMDTVLDVSRLLKVAKPEVDTTTPQVPEHESDPEAEQLDASFSGCVIPQNMWTVLASSLEDTPPRGNTERPKRSPVVPYHLYYRFSGSLVPETEIKRAISFYRSAKQRHRKLSSMSTHFAWIKNEHHLGKLRKFEKQFNADAARTPKKEPDEEDWT